MRRFSLRKRAFNIAVRLANNQIKTKRRKISMKKLCLHFLLACSSALLAAPIAHAENISGTYVSSYANTAVILQIVQLSGNQLQGRAEQVSPSSNGQRLNTWNYSVSGAVSGDTIVLSLKDADSPQFLSGTIPMSGAVNGEGLQISGGQSGGSGTFTWILRRSNQSVFDSQVAALTTIANAAANRAANTKRLEEQRKAEAHQLQVEIQSKKSFDDYCPRTARMESNLKKVRDDFRKITVTMNERLEKERVTPPNSPGNGLDRNQILYSINDDWYNSNDVGYNLNNLSMDAHYKNGTIDIRSNLGYPLKQDAFSGCGNNASGFCAQVNAAFNRADQCNTDLIAAFQKTYAVQAQERTKQEAIRQEAARLAGMNQ